jgi:hypothetical protein
MWHSWFGGWPNVLQGIGSAVISGFIAALTALIVVRMTHNRDRRLAVETDGRIAAGVVIEKCHIFLQAVVAEPIDRSAYITWAATLQGLAPRVIMADNSADGRFAPVLRDVNESWKNLDIVEGEARLEAKRAINRAVLGLTHFLSEWIPKEHRG